MKARDLDAILDNKPTEQQVADLALTRQQNLLAFSELERYNDTGKWRYKHPLIVHMSERFQLEELHRTNPEAFLKEYSNCAHNVKRYKSFLKSPDRQDRRDTDRANLKKHQDRKILFQNIITQSNNTSVID